MNALGVNLPGLIAQIVNFLLLLTVLYLLLYKPVVKMLDQRSKRIQESLDQADRLKTDSAKGEEQVKEQIDKAREEGRAIVAAATQVGDRVREDARLQAKTEADAIVARAGAEVRRERDDAIEELRRQFADLTVIAAERVINSSLDKDKHRRLIEEVLEQSRGIGRNN